jgi:hypothetical protein
MDDDALPSTSTTRIRVEELEGRRPEQARGGST